MTTNQPSNFGSWEPIAADLRRRIQEGEFDEDSRLPSRRELAAAYHVSDRTIGRATDELRAEGYLIGHTTTRLKVRQRRTILRSTRSRLARSERAAGRGAFTTDCHDAGITPNVTTEMRIEAAAAAVADALGIAEGDEVYVRDRVMRGDGEVLQLAISYLPRSITEGTAIEQENTGPGGTYARLEEAGYELTSYTERVSIIRADESVAERMGVNVGQALFRVQRTAWSGKRAVEINDITILGSWYELVYELPAE